MVAATPWRMRFADPPFTFEDPAQLLANPLNWRRHPNAQRTVLRDLLDELGWIAPVIQNDITGHLIDGHARVEEALSHGEQRIGVSHVLLTQEEEDKALLTFDPISAMAVADKENLAILLQQVETDSAAIQAMLSEQAGKAGLYPPVDPMAEWEGMPAYEHEDKTAFQTVHMHFKDQSAVDEFAALIGQKITPHTRMAWFPEIEIERYADKRYDDEP